MRSIGSTSGIGAPLSSGRIGGDKFMRKINDRLVTDFHEGGGASIRDLSGHGNSGSLGGSPTWQRNRISFDGENDYVDCGNSVNLDVVDKFSAVIFLKPSDRYGAPQTLFSKANYEMKEYDGEYIWQVLGVNLDWSKSSDVGSNPYGLCVYNGKIYISCLTSDSIYVFDGLSCSKSGDVGDRPSGLCVFRNKLYVACGGSDDAYVFDGSDWVKSGDTGNGPAGLCVYGDKLYAACSISNDVYVFNGSNWSKSGDVGNNPHSLCVYNGKLYVSCLVSDDVYVFDGFSWAKSGDVGDGPNGLCVYKNKLYVSCYNSSNIYVFDGLDWLESGDTDDYPSGLCVYNGELYVSCDDSNDVYVFDGSSWLKSGDVGVYPYSLCVHDGKLYTGCWVSKDIYVFGSGKAIRKAKLPYFNLLAGYFKKSEMGISRNGEQPSTASHALSLSSPLLNLYIGRGYGSSQSGLFGGNDERYKGLVSFIRINASVLSRNQILQDYLWNKWRG